jgi:chitosanase
MPTELQKLTAQAIVNIFETGSARGDYGQVTLLAGDSGHLTYGRAQTTLASGNLFLLIMSYVAASGARLGAELERYLPALQARDTSLDGDTALHAMLRQAGTDLVMQDVQDAFFDRVYWTPAQNNAEAITAETALGVGTVYDSQIHGSWNRMRDATNAAHGALRDIGEQAWIRHYIDTRRQWLATHSNQLLQRTVYRMDALRRLVEDRQWHLPLPLVVRGVTIDEAVLRGLPVRASAEDAFSRLLRLRDPQMRGDDVESLQRRLRDRGFPVEGEEGVFGTKTELAVRAFQRQRNLLADGIAGNATRSALELAA